MEREGPFNVLFLCTGNSARSIMAEAILNDLEKGKFKALSAGSHPTGNVNPLALELLEKNRLPTTGLHSKNWNEFARPGAPFMHFVFTEIFRGERVTDYLKHGRFGYFDITAAQSTNCVLAFNQWRAPGTEMNKRSPQIGRD